MHAVSPATVLKISGDAAVEQPDLLAVEEPLEIRLGFGPATDRQQRSLSVTMRTPGHDEDLTVGFLLTEGIINHAQQMRSIHHCLDNGRQQTQNVIRAELEPDVVIAWERLERHFYTSSSCGVCGKASIEAVYASSCAPLPSAQIRFSPEVLHQLPQRLRQQQAVFAHTGGLHAAGLFNADGQLVLLREDVGRHNALDKLIGAAAVRGWLPLHRYGLLVSGRASFELVQKALMAGIPVLAAVGAPSSLAVELARSAGQTLVGFLREERFNVYCGAERLTLSAVCA